MAIEYKCNMTIDRITLNNDPVAPRDAVSKAYVDARTGTTGMGGQVNDIIQLPITSVRYTQLKAGYSAASYKSDFFERLNVPWYNNQASTNWQTLADINGSGILTNIMLPRSKIKKVSGKSVTIRITLDGNSSEETLQFSDNDNDNYRIVLGRLYGSKKGKLEQGGKLLSFNDDDGDNTVSSNRRPQLAGIASYKSDAHIPHPMEYLADLSMPRMAFQNSLKIQYQCSHNDVFYTTTYGRRAVAFYLLGDFQP